MLEGAERHPTLSHEKDRAEVFKCLPVHFILSEPASINFAHRSKLAGDASTRALERE